MHMRIVWGRILPGQWDGFEAAYKKASAMRGAVKGLKSQWLVRDQNDHDAGYSISLWDSDEDMRAFWDSPKRAAAMAVIQPFFANQSPPPTARLNSKRRAPNHVGIVEPGV